ncbi:MAG: phosphoenolpyruvate carboxylase [Bacteriovoracaceae bacterium]|nr:phosphoenolpyruvate carboxylase [Bacteriovoracaceae bacterium]
MSNSFLPDELKKLTRSASDLFGQCIREVYGKKTFNKIEFIRVQMKKSRNMDEELLYTVLKKEYASLKKMPEEELFNIAHILSLYMELINRCEMAYRKKRLEEKEGKKSGKISPYAIIYVFTAHPTEARSPKALELFRMTEKGLYNMLCFPREREQEEAKLKHVMKIFLKTSMAKTTQPRVEDEAYQIYSTVLEEDLLKEQVNLLQKGVTVHFRTWVGGDKDGHPFVDKSVMMKSLQLSRSYIKKFVEKNIQKSLFLIQDSNMEKETLNLVKKHQEILDLLKSFEKIQNEDGKRIKSLRGKLENLFEVYSKVWGELNQNLSRVKSIAWLYPAFVLPLEFREDAEIVGGDSPESKKINGMLEKLKEISKGFEPKWYVRGLVLSMVSSKNDILNGVKLIKKHFKSQVIPLVPLFETKQALVESTKILQEAFLELPSLPKLHKSDWDSRFEVMLGYSDSAKENGTLTSRYLISRTLVELDNFFKKHHLTPVFFHGSGGSVERGGGSIKEQISGWPKSAVNIFKSTIQGEMVGRNFGTPQVMRSQVSKICEEFDARDKKRGQNFSNSFRKLVELTNSSYQEFVTSDEFPSFVRSATPYSYLDQLKIGSRPSSRSKNKEQFKIRAIPWVLCWTQTRVLFPTWWGIGSAWENLGTEDKYEIMKFYGESRFFMSFMKILGFTLSKVELAVFRIYLEANLEKKEAEKYYQLFFNELERVKTFFKEVTRQDDFVWSRKWLGESINLRAPMIHPLNLIQIISLERKNSVLLRETVTGIASGMMTTG